MRDIMIFSAGFASCAALMLCVMAWLELAKHKPEPVESDEMIRDNPGQRIDRRV